MNHLSLIEFSIESLDLPRTLQERLIDHGIVTFIQLQSLISRSHVHLARGFFDPVDVTEISKRLSGLIPASFFSRPFYPMPALNGIAGPATQSVIVQQRRQHSREERVKVLRFLQQLVKKQTLPSKMLLTDWMTPVGDQGHLGSCTGWGSTANREMLAENELAPRFAYDMAKILDGHPEIEGSWAHFCFEGFAKWGQVHESDYPYTDRPHNRHLEDYMPRAAEFLTDGFADVLLDPKDISLQPVLLKAILAGLLSEDLGPQPISISPAIFESFDSAAVVEWGLVTVPIKEIEKCLGGHHMCLCGYIDGQDPDGLFGIDYFIVKNSWSEAWAHENPLGLPGYALIPAQYFQDPELIWEALVCLAEPSPVHASNWLDRLRVFWDHRLVETPFHPNF